MVPTSTYLFIFSIPLIYVIAVYVLWVWGGKLLKK